MRLIPPVAVPVGAWRVASTVVGRRNALPARFATELCARLGRHAVSLFGSGRAGLASWLAETAAATGREEVIVPAYTCWTVPAAVVRAGLRVRLVDVDPETLAPDPAAVARAVGPRTAAVVATHLFAPSADVDATVDLVRRVDPCVRVLEDAAQIWPAGAASAADAVLLSFGRGKPLPLGRGGAVASDRAVGGAPRVRGGGFHQALVLAATALATRPRFYRFPESIPWLGIGSTEYRPDFALDVPFRVWQARLGASLLDELPRLVAERTSNARRLGEALEGEPGLLLPVAARRPGPLRLPVLLVSRARRDELLPALRRRGVSASAMYPGTLADVAELREHLARPDEPLAGAREIADRLVTLPVYPGLGPAGIDAVAEAVSGAMRETRRR
jgi:dTDP-4-amino-4,6-dideoxygalactose transaminase